MTPLKHWMTIATTAEQTKLAKLAKTSRGYLYQLSNGHRDASAELAGRLQRAALQLKQANPALPVLHRIDLCAACGRCEYALSASRR